MTARCGSGADLRRVREFTCGVLAGALLMTAACSSTGPGGGETGGGASSAQESAAPPSAADPQPEPSIDALPSADEVRQARADVEALSTSRLAAQLIVPRRDADPAVAAEHAVRSGFGGTVHFADHTPANPNDVVRQIRQDNRRISEAVERDRNWPAFVAVDQEGGPITRIREPLAQFGSAMSLGATGDPALVREVGEASARQLADLGFTVVLAPDADVTSGPDDPTIGVRSPGSDPQKVAEVASALASGYADAGLVSTGKHFPGHGSVDGDTHDGVVHQHADLQTLHGRDLVPFARLIEQGVPAVMTAHITVDRIDADNPATLSAPVLTGLLRDSLGFEGLIVTDALEMGAIGEGVDSGEAAVRALEAGADVLLMPSDPPGTLAAVTSAVDSGRLTRERLLDSAARMVATLRHASDRAGQNSGGADQRREPEEVAQAAAAASITQLGGSCGQRLVGEGIAISGGNERDRELLTQAARTRGLSVGSGTPVRLIGAGDYAAAEGAAYRFDTVREAENAPVEARAISAGSGRWAASATPTTHDAVTVALDVPYPLANQPGVSLATYGRTPATMTALVGVLTGERAAKGTLPVAVGDKPVGTGCNGS